MHFIITVRLIITAICLYFVYGETGPVTTLMLTLNAITFEVIAYYIREVCRGMAALAQKRDY